MFFSEFINRIALQFSISNLCQKMDIWIPIVCLVQLYQEPSQNRGPETLVSTLHDSMKVP